MQEKHIELFLFSTKFLRFRILHSNWVRLNLSIFTLYYGLFTWKGNCYCSLRDVFIAVAINIHNKVLFNIECFKNSLSLSLSLSLTNTRYYFWSTINHLHPNISMHILRTVLNTFPYVLTGRICLTIKRFFNLLLLPLFS